MRALFPWDERTSHRFCATYLAVSLIPLIAGASGGQTLVWVTAHVAAVAWFVHRGFLDRAATRDGSRGIVDWAPWLVIPFAYAELPHVNQVLARGYYDGWLIVVERGLFRADPSADWAGAFPSTWFSELLHLSYLSYFGLIYVPPLAYYMVRDRQAFFSAASSVLLAFFLCLVVFVVMPVQGPRYLRPEPLGIPGGPVRSLVLGVLERGSSRGAAFPSSHVAVAVAQATVMGRFYRGWAVLVALLTLGLSFGAVYGGFHYATDVVVGAAVGLGAAALTRLCGNRTRSATHGISARRVD